MVLSDPRTPEYSGTTSGEWDAPSLNDYIGAFAEDEDQDETQVENLSAASKQAIASKTLMGDPEADTADDLRSFPVVTTENSLHEGALDAVLSRAPQADYLNEDQVSALQSRARSLLEDEFDRDVDQNEWQRLPATPFASRLEASALQGGLPDEGPYPIHGIAIGEDEVTVHVDEDGNAERRLWTADELKKAPELFEAFTADREGGLPISVGHPEDDDGQPVYPPPPEETDGRFDSLWYVDGEGLAYSGHVSSLENARKIRDGTYDVSPEMTSGNGGVDEATGASLRTDPFIRSLALVSLGNAAGNSVRSGPGREMAAMSADEFDAMLSDSSAASGADGADSGDSGSGTQDKNMGQDTDPDTVDRDVVPDDPDASDVRALADRLTKIEEQNEELRKENAKLTSEMETMADDREAVAMAYAEPLSRVMPGFDADEVAETFDVDTLREKFEGMEADLADMTDGDGRDLDLQNLGGGGGKNQLTDEEKREVDRLENQADFYEGRAGMEEFAEKRREQAQAIKSGGDI